MIDTHSHIYGAEFAQDIADVISRAREAGVERVLLPNINVDSIQPMLQLSEAYPGYAYPMMGLHPEDVKEDFLSVLDCMERLLDTPDHPYIAVGEVGLDFYWDQSFRSEQIQAFERQLGWASRWHLPVVIHSRSAHRELVEIMTRYSEHHLTGIFHCFGGSPEEAHELLSFDGFCLGIGGVLTFRKSSLPEVLKSVPLERIVLETDSPYLAPVPHRGKRNESAYVRQVAEAVAKVYGVPISVVDAITTETAKRLFARII